MSKTYLLQMDENDLGQIIDGLKVREESWRRTADFFESGYSEELCAIEDCNDEHEAKQMALFYGRIIRNLERQRDEQRD
jgi:hypothetical protein